MNSITSITQLVRVFLAPPIPRDSLCPRKIVLSPSLNPPSLKSLAETLLIIFHHKVYFLQLFFKTYGKEKSGLEQIRLWFVEADKMNSCCLQCLTIFFRQPWLLENVCKVAFFLNTNSNPSCFNLYSLPSFVHSVRHRPTCTMLCLSFRYSF